MKFVLASASPRRRELMKLISENFEVVSSDVDESVVDKDTLPPDIYVEELALLKAAEAAKGFVGKKDTIVIAADTIVLNNGEVLGKPTDYDDAKFTLLSLSGKEHEVYTGFSIMRMEDGYTVCKSVKTKVYFKDLEMDRIEAYLKTGEPFDKAGSYAIQGKGALLINKIDGDYFNVVGFPVSEIYDVLLNEFKTDVL